MLNYEEGGERKTSDSLKSKQSTHAETLTLTYIKKKKEKKKDPYYHLNIFQLWHISIPQKEKKKNI